ncbi:MAG: hypothetical protein WC477_04115 [Patescibacteria group bacterium]
MLRITGLFKKNQTEDESLRLIFDGQRTLFKEANTLLAEIRQRISELNDEVEFMQEHVETDEKSIQRILLEQDRLRLQIRRLQASLRSTEDLEQEYYDWSARVVGARRLVPRNPESSRGEGGWRALPNANAHSSDADLQLFTQRLEIVASELRIRGVDVDQLNVPSLSEENACDFDRGDIDRRPFFALGCTPPSAEATGGKWASDGSAHCSENFDECQNGDGIQNGIESVPWDRGESSDLVREIEQAQRELQRAQESESADDRDLYEIVRGLRRHHAALRLMDRGEGRRRVRI